MGEVTRIVWNINNWEYPSGITVHEINVSHKNGDYHYGLEDWLNNKRLRELKIGYLDSYRITERKETSTDILLYTIDPSDNHFYHVGILKGVVQLKNANDIDVVTKDLSIDWLNKLIEQDFRRIEKTPAGQDSNGKAIYLKKQLEFKSRSFKAARWFYCKYPIQ